MHLNGFFSLLACEQALHLGDMVKSGRARGDAKAGAVERKDPRSHVLERLTSLAK